MIHVQCYKYTNFPTTGYARALKFMFIRRELGGTGTGCLFQFTYCGYVQCVVTLDDFPRTSTEMTTLKYYDETVGVSIFVHEGRFEDVKLS